jgi:type IV pilus assembly protein PilV
MAAMAVFTIGIIGVMQMNVLASRQNNMARSRTVAAKIARDVADSFERLPFTHALLSQPTSLDPTTEDFADMDDGDGLVRMENVQTLTGVERPFMGAAAATFTADGDGTYYQVAWRVARMPNPERSNVVDQLRILVMVRYPTSDTTWQRVSVWAVKTDATIVTGDPQTTEF